MGEILRTTEYIYCDGTQLTLADSDTGSEQYSSRDYYVWNAGRDWQLLFIFPTRVSLSTITLHYYSDSVHGRPKMRFYAVPHDFDIWDAPTTNSPHVDVESVPPGGEPAGRRSVNINVDLNTKKALMYKFSSSYQLAVSEVEFFTNKSKSPYMYKLYALYDLRLLQPLGMQRCLSHQKLSPLLMVSLFLWSPT